jgi:hypothetical protein
MKYYPPEFEKDEFHCPTCNVYARQLWAHLYYTLHSQSRNTPWKVSRCVHCNGEAYWHQGLMLVPSAGTTELPSPDLPDECRTDFLEARDIHTYSSRGSAALLRLCIQKLMAHLGEGGENINSDIKSLVEKGLPPLIQKSLDICRVVGNNAVHPGEIDLLDTPEIGATMFKLINVIVEDRITRPKEIQKMYESLPEGALLAIEKRDNA